MKREIKKWDFTSAITHYNTLIGKETDDHKIVGWGSKETQEQRFDVLTRVDDFTGKTVLDVGCGMGSLYGYMKTRGITCDYTGVDINSGMIVGAKDRFPGARFEVMDILALDEPLPCYDFVLLSGVLNLSQDNQKEFIEALIRRMYQMARIAVAFNILSTKADFYEPASYYARPGEMLDFCLTLTRRAVLRHEYMTHDFSVYVYHDE